MTMTTCRGCIKLGTACGKCSKCLEELAANSHCAAPHGSFSFTEREADNLVYVLRFAEMAIVKNYLEDTRSEDGEWHLGDAITETIELINNKKNGKDDHE